MAEAAPGELDAVFSMMQSHWPAAAAAAAERRGAEDGPAAKRPRPRPAPGDEAAAGDVALPEAPEPSAAPAAPQRGPPPGAVIAAYALLDLPLTASAQEVQRAGRLRARGVHPDKVGPGGEGRELAARKFRELQEAKLAALAWLEGRAELLEEGGAGVEEEEEPEAGEDEEGSCGLRSDDDHDEARQEMRAVGLEASPDIWEEPRLGLAAGELSHSGSEGEEATARARAGALQAADTSGGIVVSQQGALEQAAALSAHAEAARATGLRACTECLEQLAPKDAEVCKGCAKELRRLWRRLHRGAAP